MDEREWDYSYDINDWQQKYGMHWYDPFISGEDIDTITTEIEAYDAGYWAGWYGPEVGDVGIYSIFVYEAPDPCEEVPVVDPTCPGFIGQSPPEDPAIKELVIIDSTGSIQLSEDELSVLESLEEDNKTEMVIPEPPKIIEDPALVVEEKQEATPAVDALSVAQAAEANALSDAAATIGNTLTSTNQQSQSQSQQSMEQANRQSQLSSQQSQDQQNSMQMTGLDSISSDGTFNSFNSFNTQSQNLNNTEIVIEINVDTFEIAALDTAISDAVTNLMRLQQNIIREQTLVS